MEIPDGARTLERDLRAVFGNRMHSLVVYGRAAGAPLRPTPTLALVDALTPDDLRACAARMAEWQDLGLETPLLLTAQEFSRSLDAFPFEFGAIIADHTVVAGSDPFTGLRVDPADMRRACEVQARGHLLHLREGYLETHARSDAVAELIAESAPALAALVRSIARLLGRPDGDAASAAVSVAREMGLPGDTLLQVVGLASSGPLPSEQARAIFPSYVQTVERLAVEIDRWPQA
jgi:hypothetical protein